MKLIILSHPHQDVWQYHKVVQQMAELYSSSIWKQYQGFSPSALRAKYQSCSSLLRLT